MEKNYFEILSAINVNEHTEKKNGLTYLSWAWAWAEVKKVDPLANYTVYENANGWNYHTDGNTCWVKVGVTVGGQEIIEYLPVMDYKNKSIPLDSVTSMDVVKSVQRATTKAIGRHGLGGYLYAGEDLPEADASLQKELNAAKDELLAYCNSFGEDVGAKVWEKYKVGEMDDPANVRALLADFKAKAAEKNKEAGK